MQEGKRFDREKRRISELSLILRAGVVDNKNVVIADGLCRPIAGVI